MHSTRGSLRRGGRDLGRDRRNELVLGKAIVSSRSSGERASGGDAQHEEGGGQVPSGLLEEVRGALDATNLAGGLEASSETGAPSRMEIIRIRTRRT
jgi:hypothetical protein